MNVGSITVGLLDGAPARETITCVLADTDYLGGLIPAGTNVVAVSTSGQAFLGNGVATDATHGLPVQGDALVRIRVGKGDDKIHAQSPVAGTLVHLAYLKQ